MQLPLQITYRDVEKSDLLDQEIRDRADRLDRYNGNIISCRVVVEKPHGREESKTGWRVRLDITLPAKAEVVIEKDANNGEVLRDLIQSAFESAERQLKRQAQIVRKDVKAHAEPGEDSQAVVEKLFDSHGFIRVPGDSDNIYFHRNSLVDTRFEDLVEGTAVSFTLSSDGIEGPQASSVRVPEMAGLKPSRR